MSASKAERSAAYRAYQLLSSTTFGGAERIGLAIHRHLETVRPGQSRLVAPANSSIERLLEQEGEDFTSYGLQRLLAKGRLNTLSGTVELLRRTWTTMPH